jgi:hypothetical protein
MGMGITIGIEEDEDMVSLRILVATNVVLRVNTRFDTDEGGATVTLLVTALAYRWETGLLHFPGVVWATGMIPRFILASYSLT